MTNKLPRGIRNNNPGNIRHGDRWLGLTEKQTDSAFCQFTEPKWGLRALAILLRNYKRKHGIDTTRWIISRYAPANENDTIAYIRSVCKAIGCEPDDKLDLESEVILLPLMRAIIHHENGQQPYSDDEILDGIRAGK